MRRHKVSKQVNLVLHTSLVNAILPAWRYQLSAVFFLTMHVGCHCLPSPVLTLPWRQ